MKRIAHCGIGLVLFVGLAGIPAGAQDQTPSNSQSSSSGQSLGDYARQVRKDPEVKSKPKVFDNDNLPKDDKLSVVGQVTPPASDAKPEDSDKTAASGEAKPAASGDAKPAAEPKAPEKATPEVKGDEEAAKQAAWKQWGDKITSQQSQIDLSARELDVLQREYQMRAAAMYADAGNRLRNSGDWDKQDAQYKQQIADKQKSLDDAKQKLDDMKEDARKAGVPGSYRGD
jgi:hypothetical protein